MLIGQVVDIVNGEQGVQPACFAAVGRVVGEAYTRVQIRVAAVEDALPELIDVVKAVFRVVIIVGGIRNGRTSNDNVPARVVVTSHKKRIIQIARIGHGVLFVFHALVEHGRHLSHGLGGKTTVEHVGELVSVHTGVLQVGNKARLGSNTRIHHLGRVTHNHQEGRRILLVFFLNEVLDFLSGGTNNVGIIHIHIDTFQGLPCHPILNAALEHAVGNDQHLHGSGPQVGMVFVNPSDGTAVEQQVVNAHEIRAVSLHQQIFRGFGISTVETDFHFDVVEHTNPVVDRVVADRLNAHLSHPDTTHDAFHFDASHRFQTESRSLISSFVIDKRYVFRMLVLPGFRLTGRQGMNAVILKIVVRCGIMRHTNGRRGAKRNGNQLVHHWNQRVAFVAADDGVGHGER